MHRASPFFMPAYRRVRCFTRVRGTGGEGCRRVGVARSMSLLIPPMPLYGHRSDSPGTLALALSKPYPAIPLGLSMA